jgi:hypothetical protein
VLQEDSHLPEQLHIVVKQGTFEKTDVGLDEFNGTHSQLHFITKKQVATAQETGKTTLKQELNPQHA